MYLKITVEMGEDRLYQYKDTTSESSVLIEIKAYKASVDPFIYHDLLKELVESAYMEYTNKKYLEEEKKWQSDEKEKKTNKKAYLKNIDAQVKGVRVGARKVLEENYKIEEEEDAKSDGKESEASD